MKRILLTLCCMCVVCTTAYADRWVDPRGSAGWSVWSTTVKSVWDTLVTRKMVETWSPVGVDLTGCVCTNSTPACCESDAHYDIDYQHKEWKVYCMVVGRGGSDFGFAGPDIPDDIIECFTVEEWREGQRRGSRLIELESHGIYELDEYGKRKVPFFTHDLPPYTSERNAILRDGTLHHVDIGRSRCSDCRLGWDDRQSTNCTQNIWVTPNLFHRGNYDMDPEGSILRHNRYRNPPAYDPKRLYYRYATSLEEAVAYVLLHEYGHYVGMLSEGTAEEYARSMIIELRKAKLGRSFTFRHLNAWEYTTQCKPSMDGRVTLPYNGQPPPSNDMPPGSIRDPK